MSFVNSPLYKGINRVNERNPFTQPSHHKYLLSSYYVPGMVRGTGNIVMENKIT